MEFVNQITDKPDWERKVFDESIVAKWKEEAKSVELPGHEGDVFLSDKMFDNVGSLSHILILVMNRGGNNG